MCSKQIDNAVFVNGRGICRRTIDGIQNKVFVSNVYSQVVTVI